MGLANYSTEPLSFDQEEVLHCDPPFCKKELSTKPTLKQVSEVFPVNVYVPVPDKETELEWWLGKVLSVEGDVFVGELEDLDGKKNIVEFERAIVSPTDEYALAEGAMFSYSVYYKDTPSGRRFGSKLSINAKRRWLPELEDKATDLINEFFPDDLLD